jgi:cytochrome c553
MSLLSLFRRAALLAVSAALPLSCGIQLVAADEPTFEHSIKPLVAKYCYECHGEQKKESDLDLSPVSTDAQATAAIETWDRVIARVRSGEMPPEGSPQPTDDEKKMLLGWLDRQVNIDCSQLTDEQRRRFYKTYVMSRRLTRAEYDNSIRDLLGVDLRPSTLLPSDGAGGEGFDTNGSTLFLSPILMERYLEAATMCIDTLLPDAHDAFPPHLTQARQQLLIAKPSDQLPAREAARQIVSAFGRRAFRRPLSSGEIDRLLALFDRAIEQGDSFELALRQPLKAVLVSPNFLFLVEQTPEQGGFYRISPLELATRLAYFIWAAPPDDALLSLAESGRLHDEGVLREETQRLLKDPKSKGLAHNFSRQWLGLDALGTTIQPDPGRFPEFDIELTLAMRDEADSFFANLLREDRSLLDLIDANYTFVNAQLAHHYGLPGVAGSEMRRVDLPDRNRGGVLTLGAVLTITSYPLRTSPVLRGRWVMEQLLGGKIPPPPADVPPLPRDDARLGATTLRQQLEAHRADAACATCHNRMDPLGFGLENFGPTGRWRSHYPKIEDDGHLNPEGIPVDASGALPSGDKFAGPAELKALILARKDEFLRHFVRKVFGYALGRELNRADECAITDTLKALSENDFRSSILIDRVVQSYPFQHRFREP